MDSVDQQFLVSSREIGPSDASLEQDVTSKNHWRISVGVDEDYVSRTVSWDFAHLQCDTSKNESFEMVERLCGGRCGDGHPERGTQVQLRVRQHRSIADPDQDRNLGPDLPKPLNSGNMVHMSVCQQDCNGSLVQGSQPLHDSPGTETGIDNQALFCLWQGDDHGVLLEGQGNQYGNIQRQVRAHA